jgi:hypothetical protein
VSQPPADIEGPGAQILELEGSGGFKRLLGRRGDENRISVSRQEISVEHDRLLRAPLRFAPGAIAVAVLDPGPPQIPKDGPVGRFPILRRLGDRVIPRSEGIEGWVWTSRDGSAYTYIGDDDVAPNLAIMFLRPLVGEPVRSAFDHSFLEDLAKRTPFAEPAIFGLLARVANLEKARAAFDRIGLLGGFTDREIPPVQRRHLAGDRPADPNVRTTGADRSQTSTPPPGRN